MADDQTDLLRVRPNVIWIFGDQHRAQATGYKQDPNAVTPKIDNLAGCCAMIENLDFRVGRVVDALREEGLLDHTHVVCFSDHGDMHGSHGQFEKTAPFGESIRVPFIISGEPSIYEGRRMGATDVPLNHVDVAPTTLIKREISLSFR